MDSAANQSSKRSHEHAGKQTLAQANYQGRCSKHARKQALAQACLEGELQQAAQKKTYIPAVAG